MAFVTTTIALLLALARQSDEVPADRYLSMTIGISVNLQLAPLTGKTRGKFDSTMEDADDQQLATEGFKCIRFVFSPDDLVNGMPDGTFDPHRVATMLSAITMAQKAGLSVILAPRIGVRDLGAGTTTLGRIAAAIAPTEVNSTFLEICADPPNMIGEAWKLVQDSWVAAIRQNLPRHTLIVRAGDQDGPADLMKAELCTDRNVVYAFQFLQPEAFINQCLPGSQLKEDDNVNLPYPANASAVVPLIAGHSDAQKDWAMHYAREEWNGGKVTDLLHPVGDWARSKKVRVICDGFGVSQKVAVGFRAQYLQDVKTALTDAGIGWTLSEYVGTKGIFTGTPGLRTADMGVLNALGLGS
jgi:hypothetical protein